FQPDLLKIYPCALLKKTPLYKLWKKKKYKPYPASQLINLIKAIKKKTPRYVRIQRIARDIPSQSIISGPAKISNIRQLIAEQSEKENWKCNCIRCREVKSRYAGEKPSLFRQDYAASGGKEIFLSFENKKRDKLYSLLRLRITKEQFLPVLKDSALIRELHTFGQLIPVSKNSSFVQHKGLGKKLVKTAERITRKEFGLDKIAVISGVGVRGYFRNLGYKLKDSYMVKILWPAVF
ncbi:MAG: tRNA uridine(34) 5-carboxymethylaminomethyl modification radical SAM/GNAT enzyme Elp3, partial [Patescibacteria group bacterium]